MKLYSTLAIFVQLAMLGSIVQAHFPADEVVQYTTRELVEELQMRMVMAKRAPFEPYNSPAAYIRRSPPSSDGFHDLTPVSSTDSDPFAAYRPTIGGRIKGAIKGAVKSVGRKVFQAVMPSFKGTPLDLSD